MQLGAARQQLHYRRRVELIVFGHRPAIGGAPPLPLQCAKYGERLSRVAMRQAVVIIHGIGEQRPMQTLRAFRRRGTR